MQGWPHKVTTRFNDNCGIDLVRVIIIFSIISVYLLSTLVFDVIYIGIGLDTLFTSFCSFNYFKFFSSAFFKFPT